MNRRLLALLEIVLKIIIPGIVYQILLYTPLEIPINIAISVIVLVALLKVNFKKKWALKLLYVLFALLLVSYFGVSVKSVVGAVTLICTGYFPHRGFTHKWYGLGMVSHVLGDWVKSGLHL